MSNYTRNNFPTLQDYPHNLTPGTVAHHEHTRACARRFGAGPGATSALEGLAKAAWWAVTLSGDYLAEDRVLVPTLKALRFITNYESDYDGGTVDSWITDACAVVDIDPDTI